MYWKLYAKIALWLMPFFLLTSLVFGAIAAYRGEIILGLQAQLIKNKTQEVKEGNAKLMNNLSAIEMKEQKL